MGPQMPKRICRIIKQHAMGRVDDVTNHESGIEQDTRTRNTRDREERHPISGEQEMLYVEVMKNWEGYPEDDTCEQSND